MTAYTAVRLPDGVVNTAVREQVSPQGFLLNFPNKGSTITIFEGDEK